MDGKLYNVIKLMTKNRKEIRNKRTQGIKWKPRREKVNGRWEKIYYKKIKNKNSTRYKEYTNLANLIKQL